MRIYLDNCCLNRPYDDLQTNSIYLESEAVLAIIDICKTGDWLYFSSDILLDEIYEMSDKNKREKVMLLYNSAEEHILFTELIYLRAKVSNDGTAMFSYSTDGKKFTELGSKFKMREGQWIGAKVGLFCSRLVSNNAGGKVDVDWFRITK